MNTLEIVLITMNNELTEGSFEKVFQTAVSPTKLKDYIRSFGWGKILSKLSLDPHLKLSPQILEILWILVAPNGITAFMELCSHPRTVFDNERS